MFVALCLRLRHDERAPLAGRAENTSVSDRVEPWGWHRGRKPAQQTERIEVDGEGTIAEGDHLGGDLTFKWTWLFAEGTDYAQLQTKASAAPQNERDACRGEQWKGQVVGVVTRKQMAELVDILGGDLNWKWDWMFASGPVYPLFEAKASAQPQAERDACRGADWKGRIVSFISSDEMAVLVDIMGGDLDWKWDWMFAAGPKWDHIKAKAEAAPQGERDACRSEAWKPRVVAAVATGSASAAEYVQKRKTQFVNSQNPAYGTARAELNALLWDKDKETGAKTKTKMALAVGMKKTSDDQAPGPPQPDGEPERQARQEPALQRGLRELPGQGAHRDLQREHRRVGSVAEVRGANPGED